MRLANALFAALFLFSAAVQYNDPDWLRWVAIYLSAFSACLAWDRGLLPRLVALALAGVAAAWAVWISLSLRLMVPLDDAMTDWKMQAGGSEELRETLGLGLVVAWLSVLSRWPRRKTVSGAG